MRAIILSLFVILIFHTASAQENISGESDTIIVDSVMLREVVVKATKPITRIEGDGIVTTIEGTVLQNLGTAKDVLGFVPGVIYNNGSIEVFGKGAPVIYINGRQMRNSSEINLLKSEKIKEVKLINNPGAKYAASTNAVIKISTIKEIGEGFSLDTKSALGYRDYIYGKEVMWMNYRKGNLDVFSTLEYNNNRSKGSSENIQNTWAKNHNMTELHMNSKSKSQAFEGQIGFNYTSKSNHSFGIFYQASHHPLQINTKSDSKNWMNQVLQLTSIIDQHKKSNYLEQIIDAYYSGMWGNWSTEVTFTALWRSNKERQFVCEKSSFDTASLFTHDKNNGRMIAGQWQLSRPLYKGAINLGAEYTNSRRKDDFNGQESILNSENNNIIENNIAIYTEIMQRFGQITLQAGLRYEYIGSSYFEYGRKINDQSRVYNEFLPSITLIIPIKKSMLQLGYSRKYERPIYSQLSATTTYINQYLYESGNPFLKSAHSDNVQLNYRYKWFMLMANYKHVNDQIISVATQYGNNSDITLLKKNNSPHDLNNLQVMASVMPGFIGNCYYPTVSCGLVTQFYKIDYRSTSKNMNNPIAIIQFNNIFRLSNNYMVMGNLKWRSRGNSENINLSQSWQIDLSASKTFNSRLDVKLALNDIFNTASKYKFVMYSNVRDVCIEKRSNTRNVELAITYKFNASKSKYKGKGAGNSEKKRL